MPAFSTLSPGFSHRSGTAAVTCSNIEPSLDYNGVEFNRIFWFSIRDNDGVSAAVTVHLHHSTRLEQVQGAAIIHNGTVAALWFVKNHFSSNSVDLWATTSPPSTKLSSRTTSRVQAMATHQISIVTFAARLSEPAKPVKCFACKQTYHTSCHKQHICNDTPKRPRIISRMKRKASSLDSSIFEIIDDSPALPAPSLVPSSAPSFLPTFVATPSTISYSTSAPLNLSTTHSTTNPILSLINPAPARLQAFTNLTAPTPSPPYTLSSALPPSSTSPGSASQPPSPISIPPVFLHSSAAPVILTMTRSILTPSKRSKKTPPNPSYHRRSCS